MKIHPDAREGFVNVGGVDVPFHDTGVETDERPTVFLVHGTGGTTATHFRALFPMFAPAYRVVGVDLQAPEASLSLEELSSQVLRVIEERCPVRPVHLVGYSLGALVAATVAAAHAECVQSLSLVAGWVKADAHQRLRSSIWNRLYEQDRETLREFATWTAFGNPFLAARSDAEIHTLIQARTFPAGIAGQMQLNRDADISLCLERIEAPALVVAGVHDQMVPPRQTRLLYGGIKNARYAEIDAGHAIQIERPAQLFQLINEFIVGPSRYESGRTLTTLPV